MIVTNNQVRGGCVCVCLFVCVRRRKAVATEKNEWFLAFTCYDWTFEGVTGL